MTNSPQSCNPRQSNIFFSAILLPQPVIFSPICSNLHLLRLRGAIDQIYMLKMGVSMEIDHTDESNGSTTGPKENGLHLYGVFENGSGEGLPYAPEDFPKPGDKWIWKVGKRIGASGYFVDRYLYLPVHLQKEHKTGAFASRLSVQRFLTTAFPGTNIDAFFASFRWKIPSRKTKGNKEGPTDCDVPVSEYLGCDPQFAAGGCKAGNRMCSSLVETSDPSSLNAMACDMCCSEPAFCRDCCCILCSRTVDSENRGYTFIRCEATIDEGFICGHIAHIECGLRSYMAGTVGGSINLDAEYYCRRCDTRTELVSHITNLFQTCESIDSRDEIQKILNICTRVLRGSSKMNVKSLLYRIESAMLKLKNGTTHGDIWKMDERSAVTTGDFPLPETDTLEVCNFNEPVHHESILPKILSGSFDYRIESLKLVDEIDRILLAMKKSQESEYRTAEQCLNAQKTFLLDLYQELDRERNELAKRSPSVDPDILLDVALKRVDQIKCEVCKLGDMKAVAGGFGKTSKDVLRKHFGVEMEE